MKIHTNPSEQIKDLPTSPYTGEAFGDTKTHPAFTGVGGR